MLPDQEARVQEEEKDALLENTIHHLQKGYNCDLSQWFILHVQTDTKGHQMEHKENQSWGQSHIAKILLSSKHNSDETLTKMKRCLCAVV